jgi:hypothetical protein
MSEGSSSASSGDSFVTASDFKVTVIRRDPVTGGQWNIGQLTKEGLETGSKSRKVELEINSGAYDKFVQDDDESSSPQTRTGPLEYTAFRRALNLGRKKLSPRNSPMKSSHSSANMASSPTRPHSHSHPNGAPFSFTSPWNGACEFATGIAGRSLKCRHLYPIPDRQHGASFEPALAHLNAAPISDLRFNLPLLKHRRHGSGSAAPSKHRKPLSANASASSFGLGSSGPSGASGPSRLSGLSAPSPHLNPGRHSVAEGLSSSGRSSAWMEKTRHRLSRSMDAREDDDDEQDAWDDAVTLNLTDDPRLDLSLGLERAGGGFGGNKAKLGKLVVQSEGVLMLDLVVAANMAVWWALTS